MDATPEDMIGQEEPDWDQTVMLKAIRTGAHPPTQAYPNDVGWDLYCARDYVIAPMEWIDVSVGIAIALPPNTYARVIARSSTWRKRGLMVIEGTLDQGFRGEMLVAVWNPTTTHKQIGRHERLAQLIVQPVIHVSFVHVNTLPPSVRGDKGYGSSGA